MLDVSMTELDWLERNVEAVPSFDQSKLALMDAIEAAKGVARKKLHDGTIETIETIHVGRTVNVNRTHSCGPPTWFVVITDRSEFGIYDDRRFREFEVKYGNGASTSLDSFDDEKLAEWLLHFWDPNNDGINDSGQYRYQKWAGLQEIDFLTDRSNPFAYRSRDRMDRLVVGFYIEQMKLTNLRLTQHDLLKMKRHGELYGDDGYG
ncbi:hypothetical protein ACEWPM_019365 [Roseovarius sp. S4756]|uniref:hypothetical protein n=1 Tax=Roseovarius maritimus TaxID=3342637 RepID=UPI003729B740